MRYGGVIFIGVHDARRMVHGERTGAALEGDCSKVCNHPAPVSCHQVRRYFQGHHASKEAPPGDAQPMGHRVHWTAQQFHDADLLRQRAHAAALLATAAAKAAAPLMLSRSASVCQCQTRLVFCVAKQPATSQPTPSSPIVTWLICLIPVTHQCMVVVYVHTSHRHRRPCWRLRWCGARCACCATPPRWCRRGRKQSPAWRPEQMCPQYHPTCPSCSQWCTWPGSMQWQCCRCQWLHVNTYVHHCV